MKGEAKYILSFLDGADKRFIIPVYQRNYDWGIDNCKRLFDDLEKIIEFKRKSHFIGSVVITTDDSHNEFLVIDGQQRITTIMLLFLAMCHLIDTDQVKVENKQLRAKIFETYLTDKFADVDNQIKLVPVKEDKEALDRLFNNLDDCIENSNMTINYEYLRGRLINTNYTMDEIYFAIAKLTIIDISLTSEDDPQLIFESINSTGLELTEGDKIRNFILMGLDKNLQTRFYDRYWHKIELNTDYKVDYFLRDYLSLKTTKIPNMKKVYFTFKEYIEEFGSDDIEEDLTDIYEYSKRYKVLVEASSKSRDLNWIIYRLNKLETSVTRPYLLEVLKLYDGDFLSDDEVVEVFSIIESYIFRRIICGVPTNALNKIFATLQKDILKLDGGFDEYVDKLIYVLTSKKDSGIFPNDHDFTEGFRNKNIYGMRNKNKKYYFERLENYGTKETKDVWNHLDNGDYTIEHIMPQTLSSQWKHDLTKDGNPLEISEEWLHKAANLTLTGYNSRYSNSTFIQKRDTKNGFKDSGLRMNSWIAEQEKWGLLELRERTKILEERIIEIWGYPKTKYVPRIEPQNYITLDDDIDLTGKKLSKVAFKGTEKHVDNWVDMYDYVLTLLHGENNAVLKKLAYSKKDEYPDNCFDIKPDGFKNCRKLDEKLYFNTNNSTEAKQTILRYILPMFGEDPEDLILYLRNEEDDNTSTEVMNEDVQEKNDTETEINKSDDYLIFHNHLNTATLKVYDRKHCVVVKGAYLEEKKSSLGKKIVMLRKDLVRKGVIDSNGILHIDVEFSSPSSAGAFVSGRSTNGNEYWINDDDVKMKEISQKK